MEARLPNFIIIGAGKSGTTAVYEYLSQHPEVFMSSVKETNFFALEGQDVRPKDDDPEQLFHYPWSVTNFDDYVQLFTMSEGKKAVGEASPMYLYHPDAAKNIYARIPDVKLIAILRQPVERLYSRFMHLARENREPSPNFEDALNRNSIWWRRNDLVKEGFYGSYLKRYFDVFEPEQLKIYLYEDLRKDQDAFMQSLFSFLEVDPSFKPQTDTEYNVSGRIKNNTLNTLIGQDSLITKGINKVSPGLMNKIKQNQALKQTINKLRNKNLEKAPLSKSLKKQMTQDIYQEDILILQDLLKRDLSHWIL